MTIQVELPSEHVSGLPTGPTKAVEQPPVAPFTVVEGPQYWFAKDYKDNYSSFTTRLTPVHIAELEAAVRGILDSGVVNIDGNYIQPVEKLRELTKEAFPLPTLGKELERIRDEVTFGRGFAILKGLPVDRWSRVETVLASWGLSLYWGRLTSQNAKGHLIGHVKDTGIDPEHKNPVNRIYLTRAAQPWHNDAADLVALVALKTAKEGGKSGVCSSITAVNELLKKRPDLVEVLAGTWYMDRKNEIPEGKLPYFNLPIVHYHAGHLTVNLSDGYYQLAERWFPEIPKMSPQQHEALKEFLTLIKSEDLHIEHYLEPGDVQILNNFTTLHNRTSYIDHEEPEKKRHLIRLWMAPPAPYGPELDSTWGDILGGSTEIGYRGGVIVPGYKETIPLEAE